MALMEENDGFCPSCKLYQDDVYKHMKTCMINHMQEVVKAKNKRKKKPRIDDSLADGYID